MNMGETLKKVCQKLKDVLGEEERRILEGHFGVPRNWPAIVDGEPPKMKKHEVEPENKVKELEEGFDQAVVVDTGKTVGTDQPKTVEVIEETRILTEKDTNKMIIVPTETNEGNFKKPATPRLQDKGRGHWAKEDAPVKKHLAVLVPLAAAASGRKAIMLNEPKPINMRLKRVRSQDLAKTQGKWVPPKKKPCRPPSELTKKEDIRPGASGTKETPLMPETSQPPRPKPSIRKVERVTQAPVIVDNISAVLEEIRRAYIPDHAKKTVYAPSYSNQSVEPYVPTPLTELQKLKKPEEPTPMATTSTNHRETNPLPPTLCFQKRNRKHRRGRQQKFLRVNDDGMLVQVTVGIGNVKEKIKSKALKTPPPTRSTL